jgi:hypothetical protein
MSAQKQVRDVYNNVLGQPRNPSATRLLDDLDKQIRAEIQWQEGDGAFVVRELRSVTAGVSRAELTIAVDNVLLKVILSVRQQPNGGQWFASTNLAEGTEYPVTVGGSSADLAKVILDALKREAVETAART